jgi:hypothetical protein
MAMRRFRPSIFWLLPRLCLLALLAGSTPVAARIPATPGLTPSPEEAPADRERLWSNGCLAHERVTEPRSCAFGRRKSEFTLALVGDSHASHLFAAFERLAWSRGWRLEVFVKVSCPFVDIAIFNTILDREYTECAAWNARVLERLQEIGPDLTVTIAFRGIHPIDPTRDTAAREGAAIGRMLARVPGRRAIIVDTPFSLRDIPTCIIEHPEDITSCAIPSTEVLSLGVRTRERVAAVVGGATFINLTSRICGGFPCRVVTDGILMFRDAHHLTNTYAATLRDVLGKALDRALD